ncbi:MAG: type II toxin-antitoxin system RelE/ParE family toxin [Flavobacteriales bacterium]
MTLSVLLSPQAAADMNKAKAYYAAIAQPLAIAFIGELHGTLRFIQQHPKGGSLIKGRLRQFPLERFPYLVVFAVEKDLITVIRVFHTRQRPARKLRNKR